MVGATTEARLRVGASGRLAVEEKAVSVPSFLIDAGRSNSGKALASNLLGGA